ncbi:hypothetical protein POM88_046511 [Heracleum sosnowskyi]|uniref:Uncharacterized protein n=1 Tax=Heracleum sosnowskyi TaxID=360622 RepID=A0AAD8H9F0_9APIA|nr:hypothetical protein POM88_046511 [Heracleum sosnowskyi]
MEMSKIQLSGQITDMSFMQHVGIKLLLDILLANVSVAEVLIPSSELSQHVRSESAGTCKAASFPFLRVQFQIILTVQMDLNWMQTSKGTNVADDICRWSDEGCSSRGSESGSVASNGPLYAMDANTGTKLWLCNTVAITCGGLQRHNLSSGLFIFDDADVLGEKAADRPEKIVSLPDASLVWVEWFQKCLLKSKGLWTAKLPYKCSWAARRILNCPGSSSLALAGDYMRNGSWSLPQSTHVDMIELDKAENVQVHSYNHISWDGDGLKARNISLSAIWNSFHL